MNDFIEVGYISDTKGKQGELRYKSLEDLSILKGRKIVLKKRVGTLYEVEEASDHILKIKELDIDEAKSLKGSTILLFKKDKIVTIYDLIGKEVKFRNKTIGTIVNILATPAYKLLEIQGRRELEIPYLDEFIDKIEDKVYLKRV